MFQQCLKDIMDGYFPSELQPHYPDGVPLQASAAPSSWARWDLLGGPHGRGAELCGAVQVCLGLCRCSSRYRKRFSIRVQGFLLCLGEAALEPGL